MTSDLGNNNLQVSDGTEKRPAPEFSLVLPLTRRAEVVDKIAGEIWRSVVLLPGLGVRTGTRRSCGLNG